MAGRAGRTYKRDGRGRFASTGGSGSKKPKARMVSKGTNRLTRDNAGKITSVGGNGATARGGRLRTASGNLRATQTTRITGGRAGMVGKGGKLKGSKVLPTTRLTDNSRLPASQRPGSMTNTLRSVMGSLAKQDAKFIREVEGITGQKVRATRSNVGTAAGNRVKATGAGSKSVSQTLRAGLRELAQSDARTMRGMAEIVRNSTPKLSGGRKAVGGGKAKALPAAKGQAAQKRQKVKTPRIATPAGAIRKSDLAKVKADAQKGIGTPQSRAGQRAIARSAREAPLQRKRAIEAAKRKGMTGFGRGPKMNTASIGNSEFNWNRNEQLATTQERLAMWRKSERRIRRSFTTTTEKNKRGYYGALRASRRAAELVDLGSRRGNLYTTRKMAEEPRQRRTDRISRNETAGRLSSSDASRRLLPQIRKVQDDAQKRIAQGKKPTPSQVEKERKLVGEYNKAVRKLQVAQAAKEYTSNPYGFKPQRMSGSANKSKRP